MTTLRCARSALSSTHTHTARRFNKTITRVALLKVVYVAGGNERDVTGHSLLLSAGPVSAPIIFFIIVLISPSLRQVLAPSYTTAGIKTRAINFSLLLRI